MFYPPKGLCEAELNEVNLTVFPFYCVSERVFGPFVSVAVIRLFKILKVVYPLKGLCEAEPNGVHFDAFHFIVFEKGCLDLSFQGG